MNSESTAPITVVQQLCGAKNERNKTIRMETVFIVLNRTIRPVRRQIEIKK